MHPVFEHDLNRACAWVSERIPGPVDACIILGSGLGAAADMLRERTACSYKDIPGFPASVIPGHAGELVAGRAGGKRLLIMNGRFHYYQGFSMQELTLPVRVAAKLGMKTCVVSNAAGGINPLFEPGDIMLIRDHINLMGANPLRGLDPAAFGNLFADMSEPYDRGLLQRVAARAENNPQIGPLRQGVYAAVAGPSYETPAEIDFLERAGADAVGMSTVPEVIVCAQLGVRVLGFSAIVNPASGRSRARLSHADVLERAAAMSARMVSLISMVVEHEL
jgi:purine-nucleoside phosphorylase